MPYDVKAPRKPEEEKYTNRMLVTMRDSDVTWIEAAADFSGMPTSVFIRVAALQLARKTLDPQTRLPIEDRFPPAEDADGDE